LNVYIIIFVYFAVGGQYKTKTLAVEGPHVEKFLLFLQKECPEFKEPTHPDKILLKMKEGDPVAIVDQDKESIPADLLCNGDRVLCTFSVVHWVLKSGEEGIKFQLLSVRHLPVPEEHQKIDQDIYCGPDF
jgi:hypothetical protein